MQQKKVHFFEPPPKQQKKSLKKMRYARIWGDFNKKNEKSTRALAYMKKK